MNIRGQISRMGIATEQKELVLRAREIMKRHGRKDLQIPFASSFRDYPQVEDLTLAYVYRAMKVLCGVEDDPS